MLGLHVFTVAFADRVDRFLLARAPATGLLHCAFCVPSMRDFMGRAAGLGHPVREHGGLGSVFGARGVCSVESPAGLRIDVFEPDR